MGMTGEGECNKKEVNEERQIEIRWQLLKPYHPCPSNVFSVIQVPGRI